MKIHQILDRDPRATGLVNNGQARISGLGNDKAVQELRAELESFVCDGQYGSAIQRILDNYLAKLDQPRQSAAWIAGFFGSGKSHLLKMLEHLWVNTAFADGSTARTLVRGLPDEVQAQLRELDTKAKRTGKTQVAAAGTLPAGSGDHVRRTILSIILRAGGWPEQYAQATFCFWLRDEGLLEQVRAEVEAAGRDWNKELNNLYVSPYIAKAILKAYPDFAENEVAARRILTQQFPAADSDISTSAFIETARKALTDGGELPLTILVLDEVQQYISDDSDRAVLITETAEAIQTQLDSRVMLVASGQSALSNTPNLQKLRDRFTIAVQLSDTDVEAVTRKVLLSKKASANAKVDELLERHSGEVDRHLKGTKLGTVPEDRKSRTIDYPLLPTRRRFWEHCFRTVDAEGANSQLRSQLRIIHDSLRKVADCDMGAAIPSSDLYHVLAPDLVNKGVLLNEISTRIQRLDDGTSDGALKQSLCGLIFLIGKLPREGGTDLGVRADAATLADLEVTDIVGSSGPFRRRVEELLEALANDGITMKIGNEYRLQTTEGAEWDRAFREKQQAVRQDETELARLRDNLFGMQVRATVGEVKLLQGEAKVKRTIALHVGDEPPSEDTQQVTVWLRDGWLVSQKEVEAQARQAGQNDATLHVFLPKRSADELKARIIDAEAARQVLDIKGVPSGREGEEARASMLSRKAAAEQARDGIVREIIGASHVYQGGGSEVFGNSLLDKLRTGAEQSLVRQFPRFADGDHRAWEAAVRRARQGSDDPLKVVGWDRATEEHPVCREVLNAVGAGSKGSDIQKALRGGEFGWPQDAIDAALIALHHAEHLRAAKNGQEIAPGQLDQAGIKSAEFRRQSERLTAAEKLDLRGMYHQLAGIAVRPGAESAQAAEFLNAVTRLALRAGGEPPLPAPPRAAVLADLGSMAGNEQLRAILGHKDDLERLVGEWRTLADRAAKRLPAWDLATRMLAHAGELAVVAQVKPEIDAVKKDRSLLGETDLISPLLARLAAALRAEATRVQADLTAAHAAADSDLDQDANWNRLDDAAKGAIRVQVGLVAPESLAMNTDEELCGSLDRHPLRAMRDEIDAVKQRVPRALLEAAKRLAPGKTMTPITVRKCTLEDAEAVREWLKEQEQTLMAAVAKGPVIVS